MKLTVIDYAPLVAATVASIAALCPLTARAQYYGPVQPYQPIQPYQPYYSSPMIPGMDTYGPPIGYGIAEPPHNPQYDAPPQVQCIDLGNGFVSCTEY